MKSAASYITSSADETIALGRELAESLPEGSVVLLIGNLGAGKTTLAKGIVSGLGAASADEVASPTFTLIHEYGDRVYHIDLYRLEEEREVESLGLDEIFSGARCVLVEWGERFPRLMPPHRREITLVRTADEERRIEIVEHGA